MIVRRLGIVLILLAGALSATAAPIDIGSRRELFVDRYLIDKLTDTTLMLHHPVPAGIALGRDLPWEGVHTFAYVTVLKDGDRYRMYYRNYPSMDVAGADGSAVEMTCYAESTDGVHWVKPELNVFEVQGTKKNNVVLAGMPPYSHNFAPFLDARPGVPAEERYKAVAGISPGGLAAFVSPDGIHWKKLRPEPVLVVKGWAFDSQNVCFWSESEKCYVCYFRLVPEGVRAIARATSEDFVHWSAPVQMKYGDQGTKPPEHLYTNQTQPYFRAPHIYIGTPARFMEGRRAMSDAQTKGMGLSAANQWMGGDCSDTALLSSRGGDRYERTFMEAWLRPGIGLQNWVSRTNYAACGIVPTGPAEMSLYVARHNGQQSAHVARYTLRTDGFASVHADYRGGEMLTRPLTFAGKVLEINFSTSAVGSIRVEIQDAAGKPIPGFTLGDALEQVGDEIERTVVWKGGDDVGKLAGQAIRLRFAMREADLYAIRFQ